MSSNPRRLDTICVYCGSSDAAAPAWLDAAARFGALLAREDLRLVYGGGGMGLMGACARAALKAGGRVLGIIPDFLTQVEHTVPGVDTVVVSTMHERKARMFEESDAFVVLPGGIGTLEEAVEILSWRRLGVHAKPIVFYNPGGFWDPLFAIFAAFVDQDLAPDWFGESWRSVKTVAEILPAARAMAAAPVHPAFGAPI